MILTHVAISGYTQNFSSIYHIWQARDREKVIKYIHTLCPGEEVLLATLT